MPEAENHWRGTFHYLSLLLCGSDVSSIDECICGGLLNFMMSNVDGIAEDYTTEIFLYCNGRLIVTLWTVQKEWGLVWSCGLEFNES